MEKVEKTGEIEIEIETLLTNLPSEIMGKEEIGEFMMLDGELNAPTKH